LVALGLRLTDEITRICLSLMFFTGIAKRPTYNPWAGLSCRTGLATLEQTSIVWASVSPSIMRACLLVLKLAGPRPRIDVASGIFLPFLVRIASWEKIHRNPDWIGLRHPFHSHSHSPSPSRSASHQRPTPTSPRRCRSPSSPSSTSTSASSSSPPAFPQLGVDRQDRYSGAVTKRDRSRCPRKEAARAPFPRSSRLFPRRIDRPVAALTSRGSVGLDLEPRDQENA